MDNFLQWFAISVEFVGLVLITIELYFNALSGRLKDFLQSSYTVSSDSDSTNQKKKSRAVVFIAGYIAVWVLSTILLSLWDSSMSWVANLFFTIFTIVLFLLIGVSQLMVKLGVVLGRGNSVGGVGLVLALIGLSVEIYQLNIFS